jgi:iron complex transport system substrate-binding protein
MVFVSRTYYQPRRSQLNYLEFDPPVALVMHRIVSLIASATEIVHALGMGEFLVGRSHECDFPPSVESLPICTAPRFAVNGSSQDIDRLVKDQLREAVSVYDVKEAVLGQLDPTHILTQSQCEVCAVSLRDVELALGRQLSCQPKVVSLKSNCLADIWNDIQSVADALGISCVGREVVVRLRSQLDSISATVPVQRARPTVACIGWLEPLMAGGNWVPELVAMAGGINLFGMAGQHSPWMTWGELCRLDPEVIVVMPCGFDLARTGSEMYWLSQRPEWPALRSVKNRRVYVTDGNQYFNRPGPRVLDTLEILAEILHPENFEPSLEGAAWVHWVDEAAGGPRTQMSNRRSSPG